MENDRQSGDLDTVCALIREVKVALLTTTDTEGLFHTRPVQTLQVDPDGTLWFFTDWSSPKVEELERNFRVSLGYSHPSRNVYVVINGLCTLLEDSGKASQLWSPEQRAYYPEGPEDERLAVMRVQLERAEYWIAPGRLSYLVAAARAAVTGIPAKIIGENRVVE